MQSISLHGKLFASLCATSRHRWTSKRSGALFYRHPSLSYDACECKVFDHGISSSDLLDNARDHLRSLSFCIVPCHRPSLFLRPPFGPAGSVRRLFYCGSDTFKAAGQRCIWYCTRLPLQVRIGFCSGFFVHTAILACADIVEEGHSRCRCRRRVFPLGQLTGVLQIIYLDIALRSAHSGSCHLLVRLYLVASSHSR